MTLCKAMVIDFFGYIMTLCKAMVIDFFGCIETLCKAMVIIFFPFKNAKRSTNIQVSSFKLRNSYQSSFSCISGLRHPWSLHQGYDTLFLLHIGVMTPWSLHQGYDTLFLLHIGVTTLWSMHQGFDTLSTTSKLGLRHPAKVMTPYPYPPFFTTLSDRMVSDFFLPP